MLLFHSRLMRVIFLDTVWVCTVFQHAIITVGWHNMQHPLLQITHWSRTIRVTLGEIQGLWITLVGWVFWTTRTESHFFSMKLSKRTVSGLHLYSSTEIERRDYQSDIHRSWENVNALYYFHSTSTIMKHSSISLGKYFLPKKTVFSMKQIKFSGRLWVYFFLTESDEMKRCWVKQAPEASIMWSAGKRRDS